MLPELDMQLKGADSLVGGLGTDHLEVCRVTFPWQDLTEHAGLDVHHGLSLGFWYWHYLPRCAVRDSTLQLLPPGAGDIREAVTRCM